MPNTAPRGRPPLLPRLLLGSLVFIILAGVGVAITLWARAGTGVAAKSAPPVEVISPAPPSYTPERTDDD